MLAHKNATVFLLNEHACIVIVGTMLMLVFLSNSGGEQFAIWEVFRNCLEKGRHF